MPHVISLIEGDGVGKEVVDATVSIIDACGIKIIWEKCEAGKKCFEKGIETGVTKETIESIKKNKVSLKGPLETPVGFGAKSANVTLRKIFQTFANIRPIKTIKGVATPYSDRMIDLVIVRENLEDLYAGIEHMQSPNVSQCLKLISDKGCQRIIRTAFELARAEGRKTVHCATKANIMKFSEGMMKKTFEEISKEYPEIESNHIIVDNCAHQLVKKPEQFEVIVTTNMNGDILSDLSSALVGGLGIAPSANLGNDYAIFEAVHGSAPKHAGQNTINPTATLLSGVMMLRHLGEFEASTLIENALLFTIAKDAVLTKDVSINNNFASTSDFTKQIIKNLGKKYDHYEPRKYTPIKPIKKYQPLLVQKRQLVGIDLFIETEHAVFGIGKKIEDLLQGHNFYLKLISNNGVKIYPSQTEISQDTTNVLRLRILSLSNTNDDEILDLVKYLQKHFAWMHLEKLYKFDNKDSYTKAHGED
jgi:isocitrate dehydrogenase